MIITIDGPTASGKSTAARLLARKLGFYYLNSGLLYRAVAFILMRDKGYAVDRLTSLKEQDLRDIVEGGRLVYVCDNDGSPSVTFDSENITPYLKSMSIDQAVSIVSTHGLVRQLLLTLQRAIGVQHDLVIDGRDAGTVVFPGAEYKFFLTASLAARARRWMHDQQAHGCPVDFDQACSQVAQRDERDMSRSNSPLRVSQDAIVFDNSAYSLDDTVDILYKQVKAI